MSGSRYSSDVTPPRQRRGLNARGGGFTLIELMIVLVILGVILAVAVPGFSQLGLSTKLKSYANQMVSSVYLARGESIKRNAPMTLCVSTDGLACEGSGAWEDGWIVLDPNDLVLQYQQEVANGFKMACTGTCPGSSSHTLTFEPSGLVGTQTTIRICRQTPSVGNQEREVEISATGKPRVNRTTDGTCP